MASNYKLLESEAEDFERPAGLVLGTTRNVMGPAQYDKPPNNGEFYRDEDQSDIDSTLGQNPGRQPTFSPREYQQMEFETPWIVSKRSRSIYRHVGSLSQKLLSRTCGFISLTIISILCSFVLGGILRPIIFPSPNTTSKSAKASVSSNCTASSNWNGFPSVSRTFVFGDSWTSTFFDFNGAEPTLSEPLGNPPFPGITTSNATNWIGYLTTKYNQSNLLTYNLAVSGTTLDNQITPAHPYSVTETIYQRFMLAYAEASRTPWKPASTLFVMFIGINDVILLQLNNGAADLEEIDRKLEAAYYKALASLYGTGARNFLLMKVPPLERVWQPPGTKQEVRDRFKLDVATYNNRIERVAGRLKTDYGDANLWVFDTNKLLIDAMDNPQAYPQMRNVKNMTSFCPNYIFGTPSPNYLDPACAIPVDQYFWLNHLHPTYPIHDVIAEHVAKELATGPNVC